MAKGHQNTTTGCIGSLVYPGALGASGNGNYIGGAGARAAGPHGAGLPGSGQTGGNPDANFANASTQWTDTASGLSYGPGKGGAGSGTSTQGGGAGNLYGSGGGGPGTFGTYAVGVGRPGLLVLTYKPAVPAVNNTLAASTGAFSFSGNALAALRTLKLPASAASFLTTGHTLTPKTGRKLPGLPGAIALAGQPAKVGFGLIGATGVFNLQGAAITAGFGLVAAKGTYQLTGLTAAFRFQWGFTAQPGAFGVSPSGARLSKGFGLPGATGAVAVTGHAGGMGFGLSNAPGVFHLEWVWVSRPRG